MVLDHLSNAIEELREARSAAGMGTALRIDGHIQNLRRLHSDTEEIEDDGINDA